jgi:predicted nucleic acid-binding Zn ribbon protein
MAESECVVCKKHFENTSSYKRKTCSKECNYVLVAEKTKTRAKGKLKKNCEVCNAEFETWPSEDYRTCSRKCNRVLISAKLKGKQRSQEHCSNISKALKNSEANKKLRFKKGEENPAFGRDQTGPANNNWKGGITNTNQKRRNDPRLVEWRQEVFKRDNYTCQDCGEKGYLHAHHIIPFSQDYSKAFDLENGKTLCVDCHEKIHGRFIGKFKQSS